MLKLMKDFMLAGTTHIVRQSVVVAAHISMQGKHLILHRRSQTASTRNNKGNRKTTEREGQENVAIVVKCNIKKLKH